MSQAIRSLAIFGLRPPSRKGQFTPRFSLLTEALIQQAPPAPKPFGLQFWGTIRSVDRDEVTLELRTGEELKVNLTEAFKNRIGISAMVPNEAVSIVQKF